MHGMKHDNRKSRSLHNTCFSCNQNFFFWQSIYAKIPVLGDSGRLVRAITSLTQDFFSPHHFFFTKTWDSRNPNRHGLILGMS